MENQDVSAKTQNIYKIDIKKYEVIKIIKEGDFECVYSIRDKETHKGYSATTIYCSREKDDYKQIITREINIILELHHPTLINYIGFSSKDFEGKKNITILMDHFKNISLSYIMKKVRTRPDELDFDNTDRQITLIGVARGMMYLHQNNIIHRDLNPSNIFLDEECEPHIIGHGLSKIYLNRQNKKTINQSIPTIYMAPETIKYNVYNTKTDVYSFGILMYELITNSIAYPELQSNDVTEKQIITTIVERDIRPTFSDDIKKSIKELIERCWSKNPDERPTFEEIFHKLSFNEWEIDVKEKNVNENEYKISYFLDDVYQKRVFKYIDKIKLKSSNLDELATQNNQLMTQISSQKEEIEKMKKEIEDLKNNQNNTENFQQNSNEDEIKNLKKEIENLKKIQSENKTENSSQNENNNNNNNENEIENLKKEIENLKKFQSQQNQINNENQKDEEIKNMKKEIKQLKKFLIKQKSQENETKNSKVDDDKDDTNKEDEIQKLKKDLADQQKITNALIQHIKKLKSKYKEMSSKYDEIANEHKNHIQILAKEVIALKTTPKQDKSSSEEINEQEDKDKENNEDKNKDEDESSSKNDDKVEDENKSEIDLDGGLIEPFGIQNLRNTCYINSSLQCLLSLPLFIEKIDSLISNSNSKPILLSLFKSFIATKNHDTSKIGQIVSQKNSLITENCQQDSFEFTISFINIIREESESKNFTDLFVGKFQMITKCTKCMEESFEEQEFTSINFSIKNSRPILYIPFSFKENPIALFEKPKPNSKVQIMKSKTPTLIGQFVLMAKDGNKFKLVDDYSLDYTAFYAFELNSFKKVGPLTVVQIKDEEGIPLTLPFLCEIPNITFVNENELKTIVINRIKEILPGLNRSKQEELKKFIKFTKPTKFPHRFKTMIKTPMFCSSYVNVKVLKKDAFNFTLKNVKLQKKEINLLNLFNCNIQKSQKDYLCKSECNKCHNKSRVLMRLRYTKLPKILIFKLKRFEDLNDDSLQDESEIAFDHSFSIDLDENFNKIKINPDENDQSEKYELRAISHHSGLINSGHYWTDGKRADKWYKLNDTAIDSISEPNEPTQSSYVAFYQCLS